VAAPGPGDASAPPRLSTATRTTITGNFSIDV
jgi:hypothetical protein